MIKPQAVQVCIIQIMGDALGGRPPPKPTFVLDCDVDAYEGRGNVVFTQKREEAKQFATPAEAFEYYCRQSTVAPLRDDGKPNRPLTAYHAVLLKDDQPPL